MKKNNKNGIIIFLVSLIVAAVILDAHIISAQNKKIFSDEAVHLQALAHSIDRNIRSVISHRTEALALVQDGPSFRDAETAWIGGNDTEIKKVLQKDLIDTNDITKAVVVLKYGRVVLSTDNNITYDTSGFMSSGDLVPCRDYDGNISLMILSGADERGIQIGSLIDLDSFYNDIISVSVANENWVLLLDSNSQLMVHYQNYNVLADPIDAVSGATCGPKGIELIKDIQAGEITGSGEYEYWDAENKEEHKAFLSVIPSSESVNEFFAVGVAGRVDDKVNFSNRNTMGYVLASIVMALCIALIAWLIRLDNIKKNEELLLLREKNAEMEALAQKKKELAHADRLETIGTLTSSISHEFNNLLTPIMAYSVMALEKIPEEDKELGDYIEEIYNASTKAKTIISRLSYLSRKSNDEVEDIINVRQLIKKAAGSAAPAKSEGIELIINGEEHLTVYGNELQLHQMLLNLIINAYQAMGEKGKLTIDAVEKDGEIIISVADDGPGIPMDVQSKVFDPFYTTKGSGKGTGLGLAICRQAAEDNKGRLELQSQEGKGTTFNIYLPKP